MLVKADIDLANIYGDVICTVSDAYTAADDAINKQVKDLFDKSSGSSYKLSFTTADSQAKSDVEWQRFRVDQELTQWKQELDQLSASSTYEDLDQALNQSEYYLTGIKNFLIRVMDTLNLAVSTSLVTESDLDTYRGNVSTARTNINTELTAINTLKQSIAGQKITNQNNISTAQAKVNDAQNTLASAEDELLLKQAGAVSEQIVAQEAQVGQAKADIVAQEAQVGQFQSAIAVVQAQIDLVGEKIKKATLYAPIDSKVVKIFLEEQELSRPGTTAVTLSSLGYKIQADVSELDIGKIGNKTPQDVLIRLDAFPDQELKGKVVLIEPKEIIKEGDKYYRINIYFGAQDVPVRSGMSADLVISVSKKDNVLQIPEVAVYQKGGKKFVDILAGGKQEPREIKTGISDGEDIEVVSGLRQGEIVVVSAD
jgi:RND family efflux transporter MFP subunit